MPELPEVETTRRGIEPHVLGRRIDGWIIRDRRLRWPIELPDALVGQRVTRVARRAKYLGLLTNAGGLIVHLGMSGSLRRVEPERAVGTHDHVDLLFEGGVCLRYTDPRRFGSIHYQPGDWGSHWLLASLGPEPASAAFSGRYLHERSRKKRVPVKSFLMDGRIVVGVGNIYANEALFEAGIRPRRAAGRLNRGECDRLAEAIRNTLTRAIEEGGTTLRDFVGG
ncbi:MAG TPA: bifunctional DNA-formamidopyrimidine glycosylase/DNA-(apurinic or apyrimidinic site) lyase, partial [Candidatus Cybelea sp.]|nr:bifunctional DNA-formamidopyrimidine glycosylase/DNA-(apurinic or apyrimidinic site) lyase [Candidatus Cybelea sp.]